MIVVKSIMIKLINFTRYSNVIVDIEHVMLDIHIITLPMGEFLL